MASAPSPKDHRFRQGAENRCTVDGCGGFRHEHPPAPTWNGLNASGTGTGDGLPVDHRGLFDPPPQPAPTGNGTPILPLVIADLTARAETGLKKYGTTLRANNGRDALQDALEESYDQTMYLRQFKEDLPKLLAQVRAAALEEVHQLAEAFLHSEPAPGAAKDELDRVASYSNSTVRRILAGIRELQGKPATGPEPVGKGAP